MKENDEKLTIVEKKIEEMGRDIEEMKKAISALLDWADAVYQYETNCKITSKMVTSVPGNNETEKESVLDGVEN